MATVLLQELPPAHEAPAPPAIEWRSIADGERESCTTGLPVLYLFTADWCTACHALQRTVLSDPQVVGLVDGKFVAVRVDASTGPGGAVESEADALQFRFMVDRFPTLVVSRPGDAPAVSEEGSPGRTRVVSFLTTADSRLAELERQRNAPRPRPSSR